jgi:hypothetical protein
MKRERDQGLLGPTKGDKRKAQFTGNKITGRNKYLGDATRTIGASDGVSMAAAMLVAAAVPAFHGLEKRRRSGASQAGQARKGGSVDAKRKETGSMQNKRKRDRLKTKGNGIDAKQKETGSMQTRKQMNANKIRR